MIKQNINIVGIPILYNILEEIKDNFSFQFVNFNRVEDFLNFLEENKKDNKNYFIITTIENKSFFVNKKKINIKNIFFFCKKNSKVDCENSYNLIKYPINIFNLTESINIQVIKYKYNFQSKIKVKNYFLDLNSKIISKNSAF